jgi:1,2-diacylglycerol 3-alpha-glucosyltransferase
MKTPKILIPCQGLEHVQRGFESFARELFDSFEGDSNVILAKATGRTAPNEVILRTVPKGHRIFSWLPPRCNSEHRQLQAESLTFAISMIPLLLREDFDVIHFSERELGACLLKIKRWFGLRARLLLSNGAPWPPVDCNRFDFIHQVSPAHQDACLHAGVPRDHQFLVPYGFHAQRFNRPTIYDRSAARRQLGLSNDDFVILSLAALNNSHKRIKWLIDEFAGLPSELKAKLWLIGNHEQQTPEIESYAARVLKHGSYSIGQVPHHEVPGLLWCSDAMVQCSLDEGFGRTLVEAMLAEAPLLVHPHPTALYLVKATESLCNMEEKGALTDALWRIATNSEMRETMSRQNLGRAMEFDWKALRSDYLAMYRSVVNSSAPRGAS